MSRYTMVADGVLLHEEQRALAEAAIPWLPWDDAGHTDYVLAKLDEFNGKGFDVRDALLACAAKEPGRMATEVKRLDAELRSHRIETVERALLIVTLWVLRREKWHLPALPGPLISNIAHIVGDGWLPVAVDALRTVLVLARYQATSLDDEAIDHIVRGLAALGVSASYDAADFSPNAGDAAQRILDLRIAAVRLCHELIKRRPNDENIRKWIDDGERDPLPEVRLAAAANA